MEIVKCGIRLEHDLFTEADTVHMGGGGAEVIIGGAEICKRCGKAGGELAEPCVSRKPIVWITLNGKRIKARLTHENKLTLVVQPYVWLKRDEIKIRKRRANMRYTGRWV